MASVKPSSIILLILFPSFALANVPSLETVKSWASSVTSELIGETDRTILRELKKGYDDGSNYQIINGSEILKEMAAQLARLFAKKVAALKKLKDKAEEAVANYEYLPMIKMADVKYCNMKAVKGHELQEKNHSRFKQDVSLNASGVHIPLEIYEGYPKILNGLKWSEQLDEVFRENWEENPDFAWQFFGSKDGFMRVYPANRWKNIPRIPDLYDVRRRPWYIQGSTSPKDMLILMDVSGSVHGQTFEIMKIAVKTLLNTLEENDYVNVLWFSNNVGFVTCFTKFVQANSRNKKVLFEGIDNLKAASMANYGKALKFAFEHFEEFNSSKKEYEGAECHKIIMFFTDGGTERPDDVVKEYNQDKQVNNHKKYRIFTYAVGPHAVPVHTIKEMACENRGYFYTISAMGAIRTMVQHYPTVLARPMALADNKAETYSTVYTDAGGLGMVITVTLPIYNRSQDSGNQTTVGVVGIDTPVDDMARAMPKDKTGPNSYVFAINQNGFVILHPRMIGQRGYLEDAPDIDLLDLENDDHPSQDKYIDMLRKNMIDEKTDKMHYMTYVNSGDQYHIVEKNMTYYFTPIDRTSISLGIAIPEDRKAFINVSKNEHKFSKLKFSDSETEGLIIAPWKFCLRMPESWVNKTDLEQLLPQLKWQSSEKCNKDLVRRLIVDSHRTQVVPKKKKVSDILGKYKSALFIGTDGGLLRIYPKNKTDDFMNVKDPFTATYFKKALYYAPRWAFFVSDEIKNTNLGPSIIAVRAVVTSQKHKPAVYGMQLEELALHEMMKKIDGDNLGCNDSDSTVCYLLDDGGFIIASNQDDHAGQSGLFLGKMDSVLMWYLNMKNDSIYKRRLEYDYHAICTKMEQRVSKASKGPYFSIESFLQNVLHLLMDAILWLALWGGTTPTEASGEVGVTVKVANYSCTKVRALYYPHQTSQEGSMDNCNINHNCTREFRAFQIGETNLILAVATAQAACPIHPCEEIKLKHKPEETGGRDACAMETRYRKRPNSKQTCFDNNPLEDTSDCTAGVSRYTTSPYFSILALAAAILCW